MNIISVTNPVYSKADNSTVDCIVEFDTGNAFIKAETPYPYTASAADNTSYGESLWTNLMAGTYGVIDAYIAPTLTPAQKGTAALAAGIIVTSTATPALNGTYPLDPATQVKINNAITYLMLNSAFPPANATSMPWYDTSGAAHVFTQISDFKNFATALADYVAHIDIYVSSNGATGSIPSNTITIP